MFFHRLKPWKFKLLSFPASASSSETSATCFDCVSSELSCGVDAVNFLRLLVVLSFWFSDWSLSFFFSFRDVCFFLFEAGSVRNICSFGWKLCWWMLKLESLDILGCSVLPREKSKNPQKYDLEVADLFPYHAVREWGYGTFSVKMMHFSSVFQIDLLPSRFATLSWSDILNRKDARYFLRLPIWISFLC